MNENSEILGNKSLSLINKNFPLKNNLSYNCSIIFSSELNINDPIYKLFSDYSDIENIQKINDETKTEFLCKLLYFNRNNVHHILTEADKIIHFKYQENNKNLSFYFYLVLLIKDMPYILNYTFDYEYIKEINEQQQQNNKIYNKIITSKIIIELVNEYKSIYDFYGDENEKLLNEIINMNQPIIKDNINIFNQIVINWTEEEFCSNSIDIIYIEIIIALIKEKKLEDYEYTYEIIKQLNIDKIDINNIMYNKLYDILNKDENYLEDYIISEEEDWTSESKINFYFILLKYILKHSIYIYQIPFLLEMKRNIVVSLKSNDSIDVSKLNDSYVERLKYILEIFTNSNNIQFSMKKKPTKLKGIKGFLKTCFKKKSKNNCPLDLSISNQKSFSKEIEDYSELQNLSYVKDLLLNEQKMQLMKKSLKDPKYFFDNDKILSMLKVSKKDEEKFKEIINNEKWKNLFINEKIEFKDAINNVFYFEDANKDLYMLKKNLPHDVNKQSIENFKNWINNEKNLKFEQKQK